MWIIVIIIMLVVCLQTLDARLAPPEYNPRFSFNRVLDEKMKYFSDTRMSWFKFYMNLGTPIMVIYSLNFMNGIYTHFGLESGYFIIAVVLVASAAINCVLFRSIDRLAYTANIVTTSVFTAIVFISFVVANPIGAILCVAIWAANLNYFRKKRNLFFNTVKHLKREYEGD